MIYSYIIFDKDNFFGEDIRFYTIPQFINKADGDIDFTFNNKGELKCVYSPDDGDYTSPSFISFEMFPYVGIKDINNKKIYADCSVFEFWFDNGKEREFLKGVFTYNDLYLRYEIDILGHDKYICLDYVCEYFSMFNIVDTVQENKLRLL